MKFFLLLMFLVAGPAFSENPQARQGLLDLRKVSLETQGPIRLEGEWRFYWNQLVEPSAIEQNQAFSFQESPKDWTLYKVNGEKLHWNGYATLRLKVLLPPANEELVLRVLPIVMAGRVFVNGKQVYEAGSVGTESEKAGNNFQQQLVFLGNNTHELDIVVHFSNHMITRSGYSALELGLRSTMVKSEIQYYTKTLFLLGGIFLMAIYHNCLFMMRRKDLSNLYFSGVCIANGVFIYAASGCAALHFPGLSSEAAWDLFFTGWYAGGMFFALFAYSIFPQHFNKKYTLLASFISLLTIVLTNISRTDQLIHMPKIHQFGNAVLYFYTCVVCIRAAKARISGPWLFMLATTIYFGSMVNDMLVTKGIVKGELQSATGLFIFLFAQSILLSRRFSAAFTQLEVAETEIRALNDNLEQKVQQKTREIRAILANIKQGIFTLRMNRNSEIVMNEDYSKYLEDILEVKNLNAAKLNDVLLEKSNLSSDQKSMLRSTILASIGESDIGFQANKDKLVSEMRLNPNGNEKIIEMDWEAMEGRDGLTEQILVSMRDVTNIRQLQQQSINQQKELEYINEIVNTTPDQFSKFVDMAGNFLYENERLIRQNSSKNIEVIKILFINMHTIKGTARTYYFHKMTGILHDAEQHYADLLRDEAETWDQVKLLRDIAGASSIIQLYDQINTEKLGRKRDRNLIEINRKMVEEKLNSLNLIDTTKMEPITRKIIEDTRKTFNDVFYSRSIDVFQDILSGSERVARDLGKEVPIIKINDPGISLGQEAQELFHQVFNHIVRNSLDHGIETAPERVQAHKRPTGTLFLELKEFKNGSLEIVYHDDGRGLNLARLEELGYAKGLLVKGRQYQSQDIAELIFANGLSTSNRLTEVSGRGVGMDAVRQYLDRVGGSIQIALDSQVKNGFCAFSFHIVIPQNMYTMAA